MSNKYFKQGLSMLHIQMRMLHLHPFLLFFLHIIEFMMSDMDHNIHSSTLISGIRLWNSIDVNETVKYS